MSKPIVVGVDGSDESLSAVEFAAQEARIRGTGLHIVHAFIWPLYNIPLQPPPPTRPKAPACAARPRTTSPKHPTAPPPPSPI